MASPFLLLVSILFAVLSSSVTAQNAEQLKEILDTAHIDAQFPDQLGYANASAPFNGRFKGIHPFGVAYPVGAEEVSVAIKAATHEGLKVAARSGGHSYSAGGLGTTDDHFVIDLSKNKNMTYDAATGVATLQPGLLLGNVALFLNEHGRAMPHGRCSFVGVGGHSGHGGWGHHSRMWGLFLDVITELTVVTVDGEILTASETENTDLFWALRGASSSFGIVTELKVQTFEQPPEASLYNYVWRSLPIDEATAAISKFQDWAASIPSTLGGELVLRKGLIQGEVDLELFGGYWGSHDSLNETLSPYLADLPTPSNTTLKQGNWIEFLADWVYLPLNTTSTHDVLDTFYAKSVMTPEDDPLTDETIENFVTYLANEGFTTDLSGWFVEIELYGGNGSAVNAKALESTAFPHRSTLFNFQLYASSATSKPPYPDAGLTFVDGMADSIVNSQKADWDWSSYVGYPDERLENAQSLYFKGNYPKLQELKARFDPHDTLSFPLSVELP